AFAVSDVKKNYKGYKRQWFIPAAQQQHCGADQQQTRAVDRSAKTGQYISSAKTGQLADTMPTILAHKELKHLRLFMHVEKRIRVRLKVYPPRGKEKVGWPRARIHGCIHQLQYHYHLQEKAHYGACETELIWSFQAPAGLEETNNQENAKWQTVLKEMQEQSEQTKELLNKKLEAAKKELEEAHAD
ncbi:hypothetical protein M8C21_026134, partial [Ambrosia artemisiifolia]